MLSLPAIAAVLTAVCQSAIVTLPVAAIEVWYTIQLGMWWSQPKSASYGFHMKNPSDTDADLSLDQKLLVPAIISYFCVRLQ